MPGVISAMAEAVTGDANKTAELFKKMENGEVKSTEVMLKFSQILEQRAMAGGALQRAMQSTAAEQARFNNSWNDWVKKFGESGFSTAMADFFKEAALMMESLTKNAKGAANAFRVLLTPVIAFMRIVRNIDFGKVADSIGLTTGQLQVMAGVVAGLLFPWTRLLTIIGLVVTAVDDIMTWSRGGESLFGKWFEGLTPEKQKSLADIASSFLRLSKSLGSLAQMIGEGWILLLQSLWNSSIPETTISGIARFADALSTLADSIVKMKDLDFSGMSDLGKAFVWGTLHALGGEKGDAAYEFLANGSNQIIGGVGAGIDYFKNMKFDAPDRMAAFQHGLGYIKQNDLTYDGNAVKGTVQAGRQTLEISIDLTADQIIKAVGDGSLPIILEKGVRSTIDQWAQQRFGAVAARHSDYGE